jgi:hypothetical protein
VRQGEGLFRGGLADHVEQAAGAAQVERVVAQETGDLVAVLAAPVERRRDRALGGLARVRDTGQVGAQARPAQRPEHRRGQLA